MFYHKIRSNDFEKHKNLREWKQHKARAKKFYSLLTASKQRRDTLTVTFDVQKNLPLPKTNVGIEYYSRQLWLYNFGIVIHTKKLPRKNVFFYSWMEHESGKGSNEICSALSNFLKRIRRRVIRCGYKRLALFSDSCPGQNKNLSMIAFLLTYVNSKLNVFRDITFTFPIRGHSFLPPDRVFANVERAVRRKSTFSEPEEYYQILRRFGRLKLLGKEWKLFDYRHLAATILRQNVTVGMRASRIWSFRRNTNFPYFRYL
jgi:hypothetical protein